MKILISGVEATLLTFVIWSMFSWHYTHAILKNPFEDGYCSVTDLLIIAFIVGILLRIMYEI